MLPPAFRQALNDTDELLVSSREGGRERAVRVWFIVTADGDVYLFNYAHALRVARWRKDPWVRLTIPENPHPTLPRERGREMTRQSVEGRVRFVDPSELDATVQEQVVARWEMWGAPTPEGLRRLVRDGDYILVRVDVP